MNEKPIPPDPRLTHYRREKGVPPPSSISTMKGRADRRADGAGYDVRDRAGNLVAEAASEKWAAWFLCEPRCNHRNADRRKCVLVDGHTGPHQ